MRARILVAAVLAAVLAAVPTAASAKGASAATIQGQGLAGPITLRGDGEPGSGGDLGRLAELTGLFPAMFDQTPDPMLPARPAGDLGLRYTITYVIPSGEGSSDRVRQDVYPYAAGGAVTYTAPGQRVFGQAIKGGWFRGADSLRLLLVKLGLPARPAGSTAGRAVASGGPAGSPASAPVRPAAATPAPAPVRPAAASSAPAGWGWPAALAVGGVLLAAAGTTFALRRRRTAGR